VVRLIPRKRLDRRCDDSRVEVVQRLILFENEGQSPSPMLPRVVSNHHEVHVDQEVYGAQLDRPPRKHDTRAKRQLTEAADKESLYSRVVLRVMESSAGEGASLVVGALPQMRRGHGPTLK